MDIQQLQPDQIQDTQFTKYSDTELQITYAPAQPSEVVSYDRILNDIQETQAKLDVLNQLKTQAELLGLKR